MTLIPALWLPGAPTEQGHTCTCSPRLAPHWAASLMPSCTSLRRGCRGRGPAVRPLPGSKRIRTHHRDKKYPHHMALPNPAWHESPGGQAPAGLGRPSPPSFLPKGIPLEPCPASRGMVPRGSGAPLGADGVARSTWNPWQPPLRVGGLSVIIGPVWARRPLGSSFDGAKNQGLGVPGERTGEVEALPGEDRWPPKGPRAMLPSSLQAVGRGGQGSYAGRLQRQHTPS